MKHVLAFLSNLFSVDMCYLSLQLLRRRPAIGAPFTKGQRVFQQGSHSEVNESFIALGEAG